MKTFSFACYNSKNAKNPFLSAIAEGNNQDEAEAQLIGRKQYMDSAKTKIMGTIRKVELINEI